MSTGWDWLVRRWKLVVLMPMLAYVLAIPASLIAYITTGSLSTASG